MHATEKRIEMNSQLFQSDFREKVSAKDELKKEVSNQSNKMREWTHSKLQDMIEKCSWNRDRVVPIIPFVHGTDYGMRISG
jgi:hypothetical protein